MKLSNLKIGTQLRIAFGIVFLIIAVLAVNSIQQSNRIARQTGQIYEHPLQVQGALGLLQSDIQMMRIEFRNYFLEKDPTIRQVVIQNHDIQAERAEKQFEILYDRYLGPVTDIESAHESFLHWKSLQDGVMIQALTQELPEPLSRTNSKGDIGIQREILLDNLRKINQFSISKGKELYSNALKLEKALDLQLGILVLALFGLTIIITYLLNRNIRRPIEEIIAATKHFRDGKMDARSAYASTNELGQLSASFNDLAETIETEMNMNIHSAELAGVMLSEDDAHQFCHVLLKSLLEHTAAQMGAVYFLNREKTEFERFECLGMSQEGCKSFSAIHFEGEFGMALSTKQIQHITHIPDETRFKFHTVSGKFTPNEIITIPIVSGKETVAVISLANIKSFSKNSLRLLHNILNTLSARMGGILVYREMIDFAQQLERKNMELEAQQKELDQVNSYTRSLIEASIDPLVTIGPDGRIMDVNRATEGVTGHSRSELVGTDFSDYFTDPEHAKTGYQQVFREGMVRDFELNIQHSDGHSIPVLYNASVYRDQAGQVIGVFAAARDITERKNAEQEMLVLNKELTRRSERLSAANNELEAQKKELSAQTSELTEQNTELEMQKMQLDESNRLKTSFLSNMSHELRTPLNSVIALSGVLNRRLAGKLPEEEYGYLHVIERNGKQLLELINDILDLSRIEAGREEIVLNRFNARELITEVIDLIEPQANQKKIELRYIPESDLPPIQSDFVKCRHILQNLVGNAVKFTEVGGVEIRAEFKDEMLRITVIDTGIGIASEYIPYIFDEFRQADDSTSRKYGGTGLGLAIAKKYADMLGGSIGVESVRGQGSKFTLSLPLLIASSQEIADIDAEPFMKAKPRFSGTIPTEDKTILLVEDTEAVIIQMRDMLETQGYHIMVARNGNEALDQIEQQIPDAMILDLMMPGVDGFEVLKRIREAEKTDHLPVIILTAKYVTKEELAFLKYNSIHQLIHKGDINKEQLLSAVARMMFPDSAVVHPPTEQAVRIPRSGVPVVLIVEDNPDNLTTMKALLDGKCRIVEAEDGRAGVLQAIRHQPQLILMDIALPGMNGIEALNEIRREVTLERVPVIAVSASAMKGDREDFIALGFDGYISKPIDHDVFEKTLAEYLN